MADDLHTIEIAFKNPPNQPHVKRYRVTVKDRDQLADAFNQGKARGSCPAQTEKGEPCILMVPFADVFYIG